MSKKCKYCGKDTCIYRNVLERGELCIDELENYIEEHKGRFSFNTTGIPDVLLSSLRCIVEPLMQEISKYMKEGDVLRMNTPAGQLSFGQNIRESNQNPVWRLAFNAATEEGNGAPREVLKFSRKRDELIWIKKGEYSAYTIPVDELKRLPRDR